MFRRNGDAHFWHCTVTVRAGPTSPRHYAKHRTGLYLPWYPPPLLPQMEGTTLNRIHPLAALTAWKEGGAAHPLRPSCPATTHHPWAHSCHFQTIRLTTRDCRLFDQLPTGQLPAWGYCCSTAQPLQPLQPPRPPRPKPSRLEDQH